MTVRDSDPAELRLEGGGICLRPFNEADISETFVSWLNNPLVVKFSNQRFLVHTRKTCIDYLQGFAGTDNLYLAIEDASSRRLYGTITAYRQIHHGTADIGIMVGDYQAWGKGIGYKAWCLLMDYLIGHSHVRKVTGGTLRPNVAMVRIMEKAGMKLEAVRSEQELIDGAAVDMLYFCRFADES